MEENKQITKQQYINTPFAYTRSQKGLSLLEQNIMVKVMSHLQGYMTKFFQDPQLRYSNDNPKSMLSDADIANLPPVRIEMTDLGVGSNNYSRVRDAVKDILAKAILPIDATEQATGKPIKKLLPVFSSIDIPVTDKGTTVHIKADDDSDVLESVQVDRSRGYIDMYLNTSLVKAMFDMNQGYVSHPENIAVIGKVEKMPLMYYLVRHKMKNFKVSSVMIPLEEVRDYLGMIKRNDDGSVKEVKYPKYSQFKSRIIKTALDDIKRVYNAGQIDFYFEMAEVRPRGKKTGDPSFLSFKKVGGKREKIPAPTQTSWLDNIQKQEQAVYEEKWKAEWESTVAETTGNIKEVLQRVKYLGVRQGGSGFLEVGICKADLEAVKQMDKEWLEVQNLFKQKAGMRGGPGVQQTII